MMSAALSCSMPSLNWREPLRAMVPRFFSSSSSVMPTPLSDTVRVRACLSGVTAIRSSDRFTFTESSVRDR